MSLRQPAKRTTKTSRASKAIERRKKEKLSPGAPNTKTAARKPRSPRSQKGEDVAPSDTLDEALLIVEKLLGLVEAYGELTEICRDYVDSLGPRKHSEKRILTLDELTNFSGMYGSRIIAAEKLLETALEYYDSSR